VPGKTLPGGELGSIPGLVPTPIGNLRGCSFRNRCPLAHEACRLTDPELVEFAPGRSYRCVLSLDELATDYGRM
jgi:peptide/nickel transport system ATP-binding protein